MELTVNVQDCRRMPWVDLKQYEFNTLKDNTDRDVQKLKNAIVNKGFNFPLFGGSGSTMVAGHQLGRRFFMMEMAKWRRF